MKGARSHEPYSKSPFSPRPALSEATDGPFEPGRTVRIGPLRVRKWMDGGRRSQKEAYFPLQTGVQTHKTSPNEDVSECRLDGELVLTGELGGASQTTRGPKRTAASPSPERPIVRDTAKTHQNIDQKMERSTASPPVDQVKGWEKMDEQAGRSFRCEKNNQKAE